MMTRKPIKTEMDARLAATTKLLLQGKSDGEVKRIIAEQFQISPRTVERYLRHARGEMVESTGKDLDVLRKEAIAVYQAIIDDPEAENRDRIRARERVDRLLGLEIHLPRKVEVSGPDGTPIQSQGVVVHVPLAERLDRFASAIRASAFANLMEGITPALAAPDAPDAE
jgi:hypothetical protein